MRRRQEFSSSAEIVCLFRNHRWTDENSCWLEYLGAALVTPIAKSIIASLASKYGRYTDDETNALKPFGSLTRYFYQRTLAHLYVLASTVSHQR